MVSNNSRSISRFYIYFTEFDNVNINLFIQCQLILHLRFQITTTIIFDYFKNLEELNLQEFWNIGVKEIHVSGNGNYVFSDTLALASRAKDNSVIICDAQFLFQSFTQVLRFVHESELENHEDFNSIGSGAVFKIFTNKLRNLGFEYVGITNKKFIDKISKTDLNSSVKEINIEIKNKVKNIELFISEYALGRMHGVERLISSGIFFGGIELKEYDKIYSIGLNGRLKSYNPKQNKIDIIQKNLDFYLDLYPGPIPVSEGVDVADAVNLTIPRSILLIKNHIPVTKDTNLNCKVGFIMSNFNKEKYIAASIFSVLSQSHEYITLYFVDDVSTDNSRKYFDKFIEHIDLSKINIEWKFNKVNRGTYWIRNDILFNSLDTIDYYFINDSDDYSSMERTRVQLNCFNNNRDVKAVIVDIVRTDKNYKLLSMNNEIERYGTATTAFSAQLIRKIGYFQNVRKNADTEFISRVRTFYSNESLLRFNYPGLFQPFDGSNLTSDIYTIGEGNSTIEVSTGMRGLHDIIWGRHHSRLTLDKLQSHFAFPQSSLPLDYEKIDKSFFVNGYLGFDELIIYVGVKESNNINLYNELMEAKHTLLFRDQDNGYSIEKKGNKPFLSDLDFFQMLFSYSKKNKFSGYVISKDFIVGSSLSKKSPGSFINNYLLKYVYILKSMDALTIIDPAMNIINIDDIFNREFMFGLNFKV